MAILVRSLTPEAEKNRWGTTPECFADAQEIYRRYQGVDFQMDVCAEPQTAKVSRFYVSPVWAAQNNQSLLAGEYERSGIVGVDALSNPWLSHWWCNPPFDLKPEFCQEAYAQDLAGNPGMMLLPYEPLTGWWLDYVEGKAAKIFEPDGRYGFVEIDGVTRKKGVNFGSVFILWDHTKRVTPRERVVRYNSKRK